MNVTKHRGLDDGPKSLMAPRKAVNQYQGLDSNQSPSVPVPAAAPQSPGGYQGLPSAGAYGGGGYEAFLTRGLNMSGNQVLDGKDPRGGYRYTEGPFKGMTTSQAETKARKMYAGLGSSVRRKYEGMAQGFDIRSSREKAPAGNSPNSPVNPDPTPRPIASPLAAETGDIAQGVADSVARGAVNDVDPAMKTPAGSAVNDAVTAATQSFPLESVTAAKPQAPDNGTSYGGNRVYVNKAAGETPPEGSVWVGMKDGLEIYESGKGIQAASASAAKQTAARHQAWKPAKGTNIMGR